MFLLKKLVSYFLIPPGVYVLVFLLAGLLSGKRRVLRYLCFLSALTLYLISIEPFKDLLYYPLEGNMKVPRNVRGDVIVVLGGGVYNSGVLKASSLKRLIAGYKLHLKTGYPIILSGGKGTGLVPEAEVMKRILLDLGVEEELVYTDIKSRDTKENALYVKRICEKIGCSKVILVTSAFHMRRASREFRKAGLRVVPYPADFRFEGRYNLYSLFPKYSVFYDSAVAIREYLGLLFYKLFH